MSLRVIVDLTVCQDHGQCVFAAPDVFDMDDDGKLVVLTAEPDESLRSQAEDAADVCPVQAIRLEG